MASEVGRTDYGMTGKGAVVLIHKQSFTDDGENEVHTYMVRHGSHTICETGNKATAETVAKALAKT